MTRALLPLTGKGGSTYPPYGSLSHPVARRDVGFRTYIPQGTAMKWIRSEVLSNALFGGAWLSLGSPITAEIAGLSGYDWLLIDMEHGCGDQGDLMQQMQALSASSSGIIVRAPTAEPSMFKRILDTGPAGLMVPNVSSAASAAEIVRMVRIHPVGTRGVAQTTRASGYGASYEQYVTTANAGLLIVAQIESREAIEHIEEIAAVPGVDVLFVGPLDLSIDLGVNKEDQEFVDSITLVARTAHLNGKAAGILARNEEQVAAYRALGYTFIALGSDRGHVIKGMQKNATYFAKLKNEVGSPH